MVLIVLIKNKTRIYAAPAVKGIKVYIQEMGFTSNSRLYANVGLVLGQHRRRGNRNEPSFLHIKTHHYIIFFVRPLHSKPGMEINC